MDNHPFNAQAPFDLAKSSTPKINEGQVEVGGSKKKKKNLTVEFKGILTNESNNFFTKLIRQHGMLAE